MVSTNEANAIIETVKRAEDGNGIIVRLYEAQRRRGEVTLTTSFPIQSAWVTNLLEEDQTELKPEGQKIKIYLKPYQIMTLRLTPPEKA